MMAVENQERAATEKRKRRWFRFRFGLRTLLIFIALAAVLLSFEAKRAAEQADLVNRVKELGGECTLEPRQWIPEFAHSLLDESHGSTVLSISLNVCQAPRGSGGGLWRLSYLANPSEVEELLRMQAMRHVRKLRLEGTSITNAALVELATLPELKELGIFSISVTKDAVEELRDSLPDCRVFYHAGRRDRHYTHGSALAISDDLSVFVRASRGDPAAMDTLLKAGGEDTAGEHHKFLVWFFRQLDQRIALTTIEAALRNGTAGARLLVVKILPDHDADDLLAEAFQDVEPVVRREVVQSATKIARGANHVGRLEACRDLLTQALHDSAPDVRLEAVFSLSDVGGEAAVGHLSGACRDLDAKVREAALRQLSAIAGAEALPVFLTALKDPDADVRWQALRAIEKHPDAQAVQPLIEALRDDSSLVRCSAARVLGKIADPGAVEPLTRATKDEDKFVRDVARSALAKMNAEAEE